MKMQRIIDTLVKMKGLGICPGEGDQESGLTKADLRVASKQIKMGMSIKVELILQSYQIRVKCLETVSLKRQLQTFWIHQD